MPKKITRVLTPVVVIGLGVAAYVLLHAAKPEPEKSLETVRPVSVYTQTVRQQDVTLEVLTQGEVRARTELDLVAQVNGRIVTVSPEFTEGGIINPGVTLLEIEDTDYRLALHEAQANVAAARVGVKQAAADADVARKQLRNDPKASDLALKKPQVAEAQARLDAAKANLEQARLNLSRTRISLPFSGRLTATSADTGQFISAGSIVGHAFATDVIEVRVALTDPQLAALGLPIGYSAPQNGGRHVTLSARVAGADHQWQGKLIRLDAAIDPSSRTLYGMVEVRSPYQDNVSEGGMPLAVGLFVEAAIAGRQIDAAKVIPADALRAGTTVFVVSGEGSLDIRQVDVAQRSGERAIIAAGLDSGEQVVTSPVRNPIQGMSVLGITGDSTVVASE